ncbi:MAG: glycosyltransferase family 39 protein [Burkholderiales bacterium]|nr:glycosyltransferase family 39 protein [Burkholderiales bacterium]
MGLSRTVWVALPAAALVLWFVGLQTRPLWDPDEGRYAEIPREMVVSGDWLTPRLNDLIYFEKPPLQYWATAAAYTLFGVQHWSARLWAALTGLGGVVLAFYAGARLIEPRAGLYAAAMLASSILYFGLAHFNTLDMGLTFFLEVAIFALVFGLRREASARESRIWLHLAWAAAALAVLSKGLIGLVLPLGAVAAYALVYRDRTVWRKAAPLTAVALFAAISVPWFVAVSAENPDFASFFFVHEHFTRFLTTQHHRAQPWWYFGLVLGLGALPWTVPMLAGTWRAFSGRGRNDFDPFAFLALWVAVVVAFFSASGSKMAPYILPVLPALAILGARHLAQIPLGVAARELCASALVAAVILAAAPYAMHQFAPDKAASLSGAPAGIFWLAAAPWAAGAAIAMWAARYNKRDALIVSVALAALAAGQLTLLGAAELSPKESILALAQEIRPQLKPSTRVYVLQMYPQSLPVYLQRTVTLVDYRGELKLGLAREPHKAVATMRDFVALWPRERDAIAIMTDSLHRRLVAAGLPMTVIARDSARIAVRRP